MKTKPPDFRRYHESVTNELFSLKDRLRNLVPHWPTDGEFKEAALRTVIRRHAPETTLIGRGFVVTPTESSRQIDILVVDRHSQTLFKDGDLLVTTPDSVCAIIEVKTRVKPSEIRSVVERIGENGRLCTDVTLKEIWTGLFVYDICDQGAFCADETHKTALRAIADAAHVTKHKIRCVSLGKHTFIRYWPHYRAGGLAGRPAGDKSFWRSYDLRDLAPASFLSCLLEAVRPACHSGIMSIPDMKARSMVWFPETVAGESYARWQLAEGDSEPSHVSST